MPELDLFEYQKTGAQWLAAREQALLADEMGVGKSAQAVHACDLIGAMRILVVCPAAVRINWGREFQRFSDIERHLTVIYASKDKVPDHSNVVIISYDLVASHITLKHALQAGGWDVLILDEAHYLKERAAKRTKAIYGHRQYKSIADGAKRVWRLTGTPAPNDASELYTHVKSAGVYKGAYWDWVFKFCDGFDSNYGYKITGHKNVPELKSILAQFMLRRKKDDVMSDLPPITFGTVTVERSQVELDPYFYEQWRPIGATAFMENMKNTDMAVKVALRAAEGDHGLGANVADRVKLLESLATTTATLRRYIGMAKLPRAVEILKEELDADKKLKLVIFAIHKDVIECTRNALKAYHPVTLYGGTPTQTRQRSIDRFQNDPSCRVFVGNITAAGTGITLTAAHEVVFLESSWVPADNAQAAMRCHRIGQTRKVRVRFITCAGSVDEDVTRTVLHKTRELAKIFD